MIWWISECIEACDDDFTNRTILCDVHETEDEDHKEEPVDKREKEEKNYQEENMTAEENVDQQFNEFIPSRESCTLTFLIKLKHVIWTNMLRKKLDFLNIL